MPDKNPPHRDDFDSPFVDRESSGSSEWGEQPLPESTEGAWERTNEPGFEGEGRFESEEESPPSYEFENYSAGQFESEQLSPDAGEGEAWPEIAAEDELTEIHGHRGPDDEYESDSEDERIAASQPTTPVRGRILWPALGFPAVIAPRQRGSETAFADTDCTRCISVLVLSNRQYLSKAEASRYLRYVPWAERGRRYIASGSAGSFREEELAVRNDATEPKLTVGRPKDSRGELVAFGGDKNGTNSIMGGLAKRVREIYTREGLQFLHEIRVYESASNRLSDGLYQLFWNNEKPVEDAPSDEMDLLLRKVARPRREKLGKLWNEQRAHLMAEYEFEYGALHRPYSSSYRGTRRRAEILHPLFVQRNPGSVLRMGHVTDTHVDVRADVYEENLVQGAGKLKLGGQPLLFNNWNTTFVNTYTEAKKDSDVVLITGDLIDYGRGHWGIDKRERLGDNSLYQSDRNWFLFYHLIAAGDAYTRPTYTILGNHDWRLNPYPPFAIAGAPDPVTMIHNHASFSDATRAQILATAHGPGYRRMISYADDLEKRSIRPSWWDDALDKGKLLITKPGTAVWQLLTKIFPGGSQTLDELGLPTETVVESVEWYLLAINPFLDFRFKHPAGQDFLMLDWAEDETVIFGDIYQGKRYASFSGGEGPTARNCLTELQMFLVKQLADLPGTAKVIGIHAPPIGPWDDWPDDEIRAGWRAFDLGSRGYPHYSAKTADGKTIKGHPLFAIRPSKGVVPDAVYGMDATYGSFDQRRPDFIKLLAKASSGVRLVLSGHIHRAGLFVTYTASDILGPAVAGEMLFRSVMQRETLGVRPPAGSLLKVRRSASEYAVPQGPLYVVGTSVGPRGHGIPTRRPDKKVIDSPVDAGFAHIELGRDGTIHQATFRWIRPATPASTATPVRVPVPAGRP